VRDPRWSPLRSANICRRWSKLTRLPARHRHVVSEPLCNRAGSGCGFSALTEPRIAAHRVLSPDRTMKQGTPQTWRVPFTATTLPAAVRFWPRRKDAALEMSPETREDNCSFSCTRAHALASRTARRSLSTCVRESERPASSLFVLEHSPVGISQLYTVAPRIWIWVIKNVLWVLKLSFARFNVRNIHATWQKSQRGSQRPSKAEKQTGSVRLGSIVVGTMSI